ncbi:phosphopyruvate hydratase [Streptomyces sp. NPDC006134]|uniref:phosphopyruvate hydratase n=1 Tax=Streptomyces sp. NPDC006134 TaxID=3154467 RepID=UPI0033DDC4F8
MSGTAITEIHAWEGLDSRGNPTVGCRVTLSGGAQGRAHVPSGASTGSHEAHELRDGDPGRYAGRGVRRAVDHVRTELADAARGLDATDIHTVDAVLEEADGTPDLGWLGANAVLAVSVAAALAGAAGQGLPLYRALAGEEPVRLPLPMVNIVSGGAHAAGLIDVQDILVVPLAAESFTEAVRWAADIRQKAVERLTKEGHNTALVADEGGLAAPLPGNEDALRLVTRAIEDAGLVPGEQVGLAVDFAANTLAAEGGYTLRREARRFTPDAWIDQLAQWCARYPVVSLEDPLSEDDWSGWGAARERLGKGRQLLGDDLFVTDRARLARGIDEQCANAVLVKPNQTGTLSRAARVVAQARAAGFATVVSARSGESEDHWIADLAVGWGADQIKVGSTTRSERTAKWNRLMEIESDPRIASSYAGAAGLLARRDTAATDAPAHPE